MATMAEHQPLFDCFKTVFRFATMLGGTSTTEAIVGQGSSDKTTSLLNQRSGVLRSGDVFFDSRIRSALEVLHSSALACEIESDKDSPPLLEESSSSDDSSSSEEEGQFEDEPEAYMVSTSEEIPPSSRIHGGKSYKTCSFQDQDDTVGDVHPALDTLRYCGNQHSVTLTLMGSKGINQDCGMVVQPILPPAAIASSSLVRPESTLLLGAFDGHGAMGHWVAEHVRKRVESGIHSMLRTNANGNMKDELSNRLVEIVEQADQSIPQAMADDGGTTASMILQLDSSVYLINTGDSQSAVCAYLPVLDECFVLEATARHEPEVRQERLRILKAGGWITTEGYVVYRKKSTGEDYGLGMTRSLGDRSAPGVVATPDVTVLQMSELKQRALDQLSRRRPSRVNGIDDEQGVCLFGVSVTDGILDVTSLEQVALCMGRSFFARDEQQQCPLVVTAQCIHSCAKYWQEESKGTYRDDITIAAAKFL